MELRIKPHKVYKPLFEGLSGQLETPRIVVVPAPRHSYKSTHFAATAIGHYLAFPNNDVIIAVDADTNAGEGVLAEIKSYIVGKGLPTDGTWVINRADRLWCKSQTNCIRVYAVQNNRKDDINETKGNKTINSASLIIFDETQKIWSKEHLIQAISTFGRQVRKGYSTIIIGGNKERGYHHWFNKFVEEIKDDPEYIVINPTYLIAPAWVNQMMWKIINTLKANDPQEYEYVYLGNTKAIASNVVFPQFKREKHWLARKDCPSNKFEDLIIGIDHATANDALAATPVALLDSGKMLTLERFYDSPKQSGGIKAPSEQAYLFRDYLLYLDKKYGLVGSKINICLSIDCAASGFIAQIRLLKDTDRKNYELWNLVTIHEFTNKDKERNLGIIRDAFRNDLLIILKDDDNHQFHMRIGNAPIVIDQLITELESQVYNENRLLDKKVKNDCTDALEYSMVPLLIDCYHIYFPNQKYRYNEKTGFIEEY